jgi:hypothetical protein
LIGKGSDTVKIIGLPLILSLHENTKYTGDIVLSNSNTYYEAIKENN